MAAVSHFNILRFQAAACVFMYAFVFWLWSLSSVLSTHCQPIPTMKGVAKVENEMAAQARNVSRFHEGIDCKFSGESSNQPNADVA